MAEAPHELRRLYLEERLPLSEIAQRLGVSMGAVRGRLKRAGIPRRPRLPPRLADTGIEVGTARDVYEREGLSLRAVADRLGTTPDKVVVRLRRAGITLRKPGRHAGRSPQLDDSYLRDAYVQRQLDIEEIAAEASCSPNRVRSELRRHGIHRSRRAPTLPDGWLELTPGLLREMYVAHALTAREVASRVGGSAARVLAALERAGIPRRQPASVRGCELTPLTADLLNRMYVEEGLSTAAIAERAGGSPERVRQAMIRAGIERRPRNTPPAQLTTVSREELHRMYVQEKMTKHEIAGAHGVSPYQVTLKLRAEGIRRPPAAQPRVVEPPPASTLERLYLRERYTLEDIARTHHTSTKRVRSWLDAAGIPVTPRTSREHRRHLPTEAVIDLYWEQGLSAAEIADTLGTTIDQVLRCLHDAAVPVRIGFGRDEAVCVLDELYSNAEILEVLRLHDVPVIHRPGPIAARFPTPVSVPPGLLRRLYVEIGLSARHIELLTGQPAEQVLDALRQAALPVRELGVFSPWRERVLGRS